MEEQNVREIYLKYNSDISSNYYMSFLQSAGRCNISVQMLDGKSKWALPGYAAKFDDMINFVKNFNTEDPDCCFYAIHLDVEPYLHHPDDVAENLRDLWDTDRATAILYYQNFITYANEKAQEIGVLLFTDIPFWFDNAECEYNNKYGSGRLSDWVIKNSDGTAVMAYRDTAAEIIDIVSNEIICAASNGKRFLIGVETGLAELDKVSFYEEGSDYMNTVLKAVKDKYSGLLNWDFSIHFLNSWMELEKKPSKGKWQFEDNANDTSGNQNNGTIIGRALFDKEDGDFGKYFIFNRSNYIQIPAYANFNNMNAFTIEAWIYPTGYTYCDPIISKVNPNRDFVFQLDQSGKLNVHFAINGSTYYHCYSNCTIPLNSWSHVAAVWTGAGWELYHNGTLVGERDCTGYTPAWTGTKMGIGTMNYQYNFLGKMDKVKIYPDIMNSDKIYYDWIAGNAMIE